MTTPNYTLLLDDNNDGTPDRSVPPAQDYHYRLYLTYLPAVLRR